MKKILVLTALAACAAAPALAADVGVSIDIAQPGVYGRVQIGDAPPPLVYAQPVVVTPSPYARERHPIYLYVPPAQTRDWRNYCARYGACGQPVYFVQDQWVRQRYEERHRGWHGNDRGRPGRGHDHDRDDRHDDHRDDDHGHGHGRDH